MAEEETDESFYQERMDKWFSDWLPGKDGEDINFDPKELPREFRHKKFDFDDITFRSKSKKPTKIRTEGDLSRILCSVIQNVFDLAACRSTGEDRVDFLQIKDTSVAKVESDDPDRPDLSVHKASAAQAFHLDDADKQDVSPDSHRAFIGRVAYSWTIFPGVVKIDSSREGFGFSADELDLPDTEGSRETRGQFAGHVTEILSRQHRQFTFAFYVYKNLARLFAVDRNSAIMTPPFDYVKDPNTLLKFFYRLARADNCAQGEHMSEDHGVIQPLILDAMNDALDHGPTSTWPLYEVQVHDHISGKTSCFVIGKPRKPATSLFGRATRGYVGFDSVEHDFVWLKDAWRSDSLNSHPEWEIYSKLKNANVKNIATMRCGGDVYNPKLQCTLSQDYISSPLLKRRIHSRLIINEIGFPLDAYETSRILIYIVLCAFQAHESAWVKAGILHHDISDNNMLIIHVNGKKRGLLIDWDLCKYASELQERKPLRQNASGTWAFTCAVRLHYPKKFLELADDIEAFVHVIIWCALRYHRHSLLRNPGDFALVVHQLFFDCTCSSDGLLYGCFGKWHAIMYGTYSFQLISDERFQNVLDKLMRLCRSHYRSLDLIELERFLPADILKKIKAPQQTYTITELPVDLDALRSPYEDPEEDDDITFKIAAPDVHEEPAIRTLDEHVYIGQILYKAIQDEDWNCWRSSGVDHFETMLHVSFTERNRPVDGTRSVETFPRKRARSPQASSIVQPKRFRASSSAHNSTPVDGSTFERAALCREQDADTQSVSPQPAGDIEASYSESEDEDEAKVNSIFTAKLHDELVS
ncbi:unnamed protein product [Somion occarium]|uniref:Fungal-type protein kinase domain-containing protein n=1 Tax=Somion occarium TaxID=3059160 RepID=A0ABP1E7C8_9APHY